MCGQEDISLADALELSRTAGEKAGKAAASWVFDGNTEESYYAWILKGIDDGDPKVQNTLMDQEPRGDAREVCDEIGVDYDLSTTADADLIIDAWREEAQQAFWWEVERLAREHIGHYHDPAGKYDFCADPSCPRFKEET